MAPRAVATEKESETGGAESAQQQDWDAFKAAKAAEGWTEVAPRVLERQLGGRVENLGYGEQGVAWTLGQLQKQLEFLQEEHRNYPSADLARTISETEKLITRRRHDLFSMSANARTGGAFEDGANVAGPSCSSICYSATADAYPTNSPGGVAASAGATFNSSCGFWGDTYAYAYARATQGNTTTTVSQADPRSGPSIGSSAYASAPGSTNCYSTANSYAQSSALGISYSTWTENYSCPSLPPVQPTINGSTYEYFSSPACRYVTWTSWVTGGTGSYTNYSWKRNGSWVGGGTSLTQYVCYYDSDFNLELTVTDSASNSGSDTHYVTVYYEEPCGPCGCYYEQCP